jgi:serine/threonine-protein kinase
MPEHDKLIDDLPSDDWGKLGWIIKRFEYAWRRGERPEIDEYLPTNDPERVPKLVELIHVELECRLKHGETPRVEDYLKRYPELTADPAVVLDLIVAEFQVRRRTDTTVTPAEYLERFPQFSAQLSERLQLPPPALPTPRPDPGKKQTVHADPVPPMIYQTQPDPAMPLGIQRKMAAGCELLEKLGEGGMGIVYKARQVKLKRLVALKMLLAGENARPDELTRFRLEAESAARLQHPNVVQCYEVGEENGRPYFIQEFVDGGTLTDKLGGKTMPPREAAKLIETLARAMYVAHSRNIVHRDLKPSNILLTTEGVPKITDFGLAKQIDNPSHHTKHGVVMGTPSYMAPEQAEGLVSKIGPVSDVYSLGAILYECLTGRPPFLAASNIETLWKVMTEQPVPPSRLLRLPADLETICLKCLE